jgi:hypothetical protein
MLIIASIVSMVLGEYEAGSVIILIVVMNAILGVVQVSTSQPQTWVLTSSCAGISRWCRFGSFGISLVSHRQRAA